MTTVLRTVRVPPGLWSAARAVAERRGETVSEVIRRALVAYVRRHESAEGHAEQQQRDAEQDSDEQDQRGSVIAHAVTP